MKKIVIGILAHVDAGKTTLSESMLYLSGSIRKIGRVDNGDAFLDTHALERARGITIFSKQAEFMLGDTKVTLLDTPGHVDFSAEMERTLQVLDYAILVISGADGVQGHTLTLWRLLEKYKIPVFLFVNKMDQNGTNRDALLTQLKSRLGQECLDFNVDQREDTFLENIAMCEEQVLERYLESGTIEQEDIVWLIATRKVFPCYFGSALKLEGIEAFLNGLEHYTGFRSFPEEFGAKVYKIARDDQGNRLTYMKITGGSLKVKALLTNRLQTIESEHSYVSSEVWEEKVNQIRIYSGVRYDSVNEVTAGTVCAVTGLSKTYPGEGLGIEAASDMPILEPVLTYRIQLPPQCDVNSMLIKLRQLEEEEPQLHIVWDERLNEIQAQLMGEIQIEVLKSLIQERFQVAVELSTGSIVYKETILEPVEGVGHFEPLRHYAEVHLLMEPAKRGSGLQFATDCSEDVLDRNWQRLILTHLEERSHKGVRTGFPITDMKITLVAGRAHQKHTEGGDFRQATYRAIRQGLMQAKSILLEPYYQFRIEVPTEMVGRALSDIEKMHGEFQSPQLEGEMSIITGTAPVATMQEYQTEVISYTKGRGRLFCSLKGYEPCHNTEQVVERIGYDAKSDVDHPASSVFCSHGAGIVIEWDKVQEHMHVQSGLRLGSVKNEADAVRTTSVWKKERLDSYQNEKELEEIFTRTYGKSKREDDIPQKTRYHGEVVPQYTKPKKTKVVEEYLLVDGYNIVFAWEELKVLAEVNMDAARGKLMDILCNYQGYKKCIIILVFDAYKVEGNLGEMLDYHNIHVVYTKEAETADQYIEKMAHQIGRTYHVTVATSDGLEQLIIRGQGCDLLSARELKEEIEYTNKQMRGEYTDKQKNPRNYLFDYLSDEMADYMEEVRLGRKK